MWYFYLNRTVYVYTQQAGDVVQHLIDEAAVGVLPADTVPDRYGFSETCLRTTTVTALYMYQCAHRKTALCST